MMKIVVAVLGLLCAPACASIHGAAPGSILPALVPGSGFSGATAVPPAQGSSGDLGYVDNAIAGWGSVQFQTVGANALLPVCVDAFHVNAIAKVSFSVAGGPWVDRPTPWTTAAAGQPEYCVNVAASSFTSDGVVEVRAIAYPVAGNPVVLQGGATSGTTTPVKNNSSLWLYIAQNGTLPAVTQYVTATGTDSSNCTSGAPCLTVYKAVANLATLQSGSDAGGGTVCIASDGNYAYGPGTTPSPVNAASQWVTIKPCGAATQTGVVFTSIGTSSGLRAQKIHLQNLSVNGFALGTSSTVNSSSPYLWLDNVLGTGLSPAGTGQTVSQYASFSAFYTGGAYTNYVNGPSGILVEGTNTYHIGEDCLSNSQSAINNTCSDMGVYYATPLYNPTSNSGNTIYLSSTSGLIQGLTVLGANIPGSCTSSPTTISSITPDVSITLSAATTGTVSSFSATSCDHPDVYQLTYSSSNFIFYGNTAVSSIIGQGVFSNGITSSGLAVENNNVTSSQLDGTFYVMQFGPSVSTSLTNAIFQGNVWDGPMAWRTTATFSEVYVRGDSCGSPPAAMTGVTILSGNC